MTANYRFSAEKRLQAAGIRAENFCKVEQFIDKDLTSE